MIQRASENCAEAIRLSPQDAALRNEWATLHLSTGQFEEAQEKITESLEVDPALKQTWTIPG